MALQRRVLLLLLLLLRCESLMCLHGPVLLQCLRMLYIRILLRVHRTRLLLRSLRRLLLLLLRWWRRVMRPPIDWLLRCLKVLRRPACRRRCA
jgi:hypothetical protein